MKLAEQLREISSAEEDERLKLANEFLERIKGHREEQILRLCAEAAADGAYKALMKPCHFPAELKAEGLTFDTFWGHLFACWDM